MTNSSNTKDSQGASASDTSPTAQSNQVVTRSELEANKSIGWYVNPGGVVYQTITISPLKVRFVGRLVEVTDLVKENPDASEQPIKSATKTNPQEMGGKDNEY